MRLHQRLKAISQRLVAAMFLAPILVAARPAAAEPALWIVRSSTATVYLFGTVHNLPAKMDWRSPIIDRALAASQEVWTEADSSDLTTLVRLIRRYGLSSNTSLHSVLPKRYRARYDMEMSSAGLNTDLYGHVKPWLATMLLDGGAMRRSHIGFGVETDLLAYARKHHKGTPTFETADQQFSILSDLPIQSQARALELQIEGFPSANGQMNELVRAWLNGNDKLVDKLSNQPLAQSDERYFDDVIVRRNENFAQTIATRLQGSGTAFVAVGAAHLCGANSIQYFLHNYNLDAVRLQGAAAGVGQAKPS